MELERQDCMVCLRALDVNLIMMYVELVCHSLIIRGNDPLVGANLPLLSVTRLDLIFRV